MLRTKFISLIIMCFLCSNLQLNAYGQSISPEVQDQEQGLVIVEPSNAVRINKKSRKAEILPYSQRRLKYGSNVNIGVSKFKPKNYDPNFQSLSFEESYGSDSSLMYLLEANFKRNYSFFSLGVELGLGYGKKNSNVSTTLETTLVKLGGQLAIDNIFTKTQYMGAYLSAGTYQVFFNESFDTNSFKGSTQISFYGAAGLMFNLNWLDPDTAEQAYFDSGLENTYLYVEITQLVKSQEAVDPDFSSLHANAGLKLEF